MKEKEVIFEFTMPIKIEKLIQRAVKRSKTVRYYFWLASIKPKQL